MLTKVKPLRLFAYLKDRAGKVISNLKGKIVQNLSFKESTYKSVSMLSESFREDDLSTSNSCQVETEPNKDSPDKFKPQHPEAEQDFTTKQQDPKSNDIDLQKRRLKLQMFHGSSNDDIPETSVTQTLAQASQYEFAFSELNTEQIDCRPEINLSSLHGQGSHDTNFSGDRGGGSKDGGQGCSGDGGGSGSGGNDGSGGQRGNSSGGGSGGGDEGKRPPSQNAQATCPESDGSSDSESDDDGGQDMDDSQPLVHGPSSGPVQRLKSNVLLSSPGSPGNALAADKAQKVEVGQPGNAPANKPSFQPAEQTPATDVHAKAEAGNQRKNPAKEPSLQPANYTTDVHQNAEARGQSTGLEMQLGPPSSRHPPATNAHQSAEAGTQDNQPNLQSASPTPATGVHQRVGAGMQSNNGPGSLRLQPDKNGFRKVSGPVLDQQSDLGPYARSSLSPTLQRKGDDVQNQQPGAVSRMPAKREHNTPQMNTAGTPGVADTTRRENHPSIPRSSMSPFLLRQPYNLVDHGQRGTDRTLCRTHSLSPQVAEVRMRERHRLVDQCLDDTYGGSVDDSNEENIVDLTQRAATNPNMDQLLAGQSRDEANTHIHRPSNGNSDAAAAAKRQRQTPTRQQPMQIREGTTILNEKVLTQDTGRPPGRTVDEVSQAAECLPGDIAACGRESPQGSFVESLAPKKSEFPPFPAAKGKTDSGCGGEDDPRWLLSREELCDLCNTYTRREQLCPCGHSLCEWCGLRYLGDLSQNMAIKRLPCPQCGLLIDQRIPV